LIHLGRSLTLHLVKAIVAFKREVRAKTSSVAFFARKEATDYNSSSIGVHPP